VGSVFISHMLHIQPESSMIYHLPFHKPVVIINAITASLVCLYIAQVILSNRRSSPMKNFVQSNYKWYILALTMLSYGVIAGAERMCMPVLFKQISADLGFGVVSIGTIWGMDPLAGIFVGLLGGLLVDRLGIKRTLTVVCILAGILCALRGLAVNFVSMAAAMFLFGMMAAMMPGIVPKTTAVWFKTQQLGLTNALINIAGSVGSMIATMTSATILSPLLGGWRYVLFLLGAPAVVTGILWHATAREPEKKDVQITTASQVPFRQALSGVIHIKEVWIIGLISLTLWGANTGLIGYLPLYLRDIGWRPIIADSAVTVVNGTYMIGTIPMILLASRFTGYKVMLFFSMTVTFVSLALLTVINGTAIWPLLIISTFLRSSASAVINVLILETQGVGSTYGGTAIGLASSIGMVGGFLSPPLGNSFANIAPAMPFFFWSSLAALSLPLFLFIRKPEGGKK
jgi:nitrate/nitrite transporter NarK